MMLSKLNDKCQNVIPNILCKAHLNEQGQVLNPFDNKGGRGFTPLNKVKLLENNCFKKASYLSVSGLIPPTGLKHDLPDIPREYR